MSKNKNTSVAGNDDFADELFDVEGFDNVIVLEDENGNEVEFELLDVMEYENDNYIVMTETGAGEEAGVIILKVEPSDENPDEESYVGIEDEKLVLKLYDMFKEKHKDDFNFAE